MTSLVLAEPTETIRVLIKPQSGGELRGLVVDHNDHGLVIVQHNDPYVFSWKELDPGNAYTVKRSLIHFARGEEELIAQDFFDLGQFALHVGRVEIAARNFRRAQELDFAFKPAIRDAFEIYRERKKQRKLKQNALIDGNSPATVTQSEPNPKVSNTPTPRNDSASAALKAYRTFAQEVQKVLGNSVKLLESDHFLIGTDFEKRYHGRLIDWCETMYDTLCQQFKIEKNHQIFLSKIPIFCFLAEKRFRKFAQHFDGYSAVASVGYTRYISDKAHVHVVLLRQGRSLDDFDRFACTLVHEGTHAFIHRLHASSHIPSWVNEGLAELIAERVLGERCPAGENADLLALQYARYDWSALDLIQSTKPIQVHQYALACSLMMYLDSLGAERLAGFVSELKRSVSVGEALVSQFDGITPEELEIRWKTWIRSR